MQNSHHEVGQQHPPYQHSLSELMDIKINEIDSRTSELISQGVSHSGKTFSLSLNAQISLMGLVLKKDKITYPFEISTKNNGVHSVFDVIEMDLIGMTALNAISAHKKTGNEQKAIVRLIMDIDELKNYSDPR